MPSPRPLILADADALGRLAYQAFKGGVDDRGEGIDEHVRDMRRTLAGEFGRLMVEPSAAIATAHVMLAAIVITWEHEAPFMPYCVTAPALQRQGVATHLIARTAQVLCDQGHRQLVLAVVEGNPAQRLYLRLGFREFPVPDSSQDQRHA